MGPTGMYNVGPMALALIIWQDVQQLPDDGNRYEALEGEPYVTPPPRCGISGSAGDWKRALYALVEGSARCCTLRSGLSSPICPMQTHLQAAAEC